MGETLAAGMVPGMTATLRPTNAPRRVAARLSLSGRLPWALLLAASLGMFTAAASGTTRAPFLIEMARDLSVSVPLVANLVAATSIAWGITSMFAGAGSDRWGRRPFLIGGPLALAVTASGVATAGQLPWRRHLGNAGRRVLRPVHRRDLHRGLGPRRSRSARTRAWLGHERPVAHAAGGRAAGRLGRVKPSAGAASICASPRWHSPRPSA